MEAPAEHAEEDSGKPLPQRPTAHDHENARVRQEIAERQEREYVECLQWELGAFGPGWLPSHRHFLLSKEEEEQHRRTGEKAEIAATVYTVKNDAGETRHFSVEDGSVVKHDSYEAGFGAMLLEPHPTRGFEHQGQWCRTHRYSLCLAPYELYYPKTAEQLAALRESRARKKAEREDTKWAQDNPLLASAGIRRQDLE